MSNTIRVNNCTEEEAFCRIYSVRTKKSINVDKIIVLFPDDGIVEESLDLGDAILGHQYLDHDFCEGYLKTSMDYMLRRGELTSLLNLFIQLVMSGMDYYRENYVIINQRGIEEMSVDILPPDAVNALYTLQEEYGEDDTHLLTTSFLLLGIGMFAKAPPDHFLNIGQN